jgi:methylated-DNA-[protein]-cysteine S-methyltransferase
MISIATYESPVGALTVVADGHCVCLLHFGARDAAVDRFLARWYPGERVVDAADPAGAVTALHAYFAGDLHAIDTVPVDLHGTPFQQRVWAALRDIPAGRPVSYQTIARTIGAPAAVRAVGAANGANPVAIVVPCHRVIGSNGTLTGYGGGLDRKRWLLHHEQGGLF